MNNFQNTESNFKLISSLTFKVLNQTSPNLQGSCRSTSWWCMQNYMENSCELTFESTSKWITFKNTHSNSALLSLIIFEVLNQTSPNSQGSCRNTSRWCLQNYGGNGWALTSELTPKIITFKNTHSNFTLISLIIVELLNQTLPNLQEICRNTSRWCLQTYRENGCELASKATSKWITFKNTHSNFSIISLLIFKVLIQTSPNLHGSCRNTRFKYKPIFN